MAKKYEYDYPHPAVATDCVVFGFDGRDLKVLLIERGLDPYKGMWAFPGGFMRIDETAEECAVRELKEETGLVLTNVRQLGAFSGVHRDPRERIVSIAFYALARQSEVKGGDDAAKAKWWSIILRQAMNRIRQDIHFEPVGFGLLEERFTIADLQRLYESILGVHFDRRNFYNKMLKTGILQEVDEDEERGSAVDRIKRIHELLRGDTPAPQYYGKNREMKSKGIDALFCDEDAGAIPAPMAAPMCCETASFEEDDDIPVRSHTVGRKGKLFRFDKESYDRLKEGSGFRLEF